MTSIFFPTQINITPLVSPKIIREEKKYNPFLRFDEPSLVSELQKRNPELDGSPRSVFKELRKLRDDWQ